MAEYNTIQNPIKYPIIITILLFEPMTTLYYIINKKIFGFHEPKQNACVSHPIAIYIG